MPTPRTELLRRLADYTLPIEPVLAELRDYGWDAETPLFTITRQHVLGILSRYLDGQLTTEQVTDWADLVECREDLGYEHGFEEQLKRAVFELANPNLTEAVTPRVALSQTLPTIREKKLAYMQSFMLLTAVAFENLLKGIAVTDDPTSWRRLQDDSGHGISTFAAAVTVLSDEERDLLVRVQEHLVWAGRYTIPTKAKRYASNHGLLVLRGTDPSTISALFERLSRILQHRVSHRA